MDRLTSYAKKWIERTDLRAWLNEAYRRAAVSPDPSTQNAALLLDPFPRLQGEEQFDHAWGVTSYPEGVQHKTPRLDRQHKYLYLEHAERAAIYAAANRRMHLFGSILLCPYAACADCARAVCATGICAVVRHKADMHSLLEERWGESIRAADVMLKEAGVPVVEVTGSFEGCEILFAGERRTPK